MHSHRCSMKRNIKGEEKIRKRRRVTEEEKEEVWTGE